MASKSGQEPSASTEDIEELLDVLDKTLDRLKTLYEQYFLGIQKQAPAYIHSDVERKLRDLMQLQIRNTGLRYRLNSIQAKFAAYNSYWRRTLRQIENGTYIRNLSKIGRQAARSGADIPEEILAAMPKRMREQVLKDREVALAAAKRHHQVDENGLPPEVDEDAAFIKEGTELRRQVRGAHVVKDEGDFDIDAFFKEVESQSADDKTPEDQPPVAPAPPVRPVVPPMRASQPIPTHPRPDTTPGTGYSRPNTAGPGYPRGDTEPGMSDAPGLLRPPPGPVPRAPTNPGLPPVPPPRIPTAPSQAVRPNPIAPGSAAARGDVPVESMAGPFPRQPTGPVPNPSATGPVPRMPTGPVPNPSATGPVPRMPTGPVPRMPTGPVPRMPTGPVPNSGAVPRSPTGPVPNPSATGPVPRQPGPGASGPIPVMTETGPVPRMPTNPGTGPVPRQPTGPVARPPGAPRPAPPVSAQSQPTRPTPSPAAQEPGLRPPPGMNDADVNALYAKYVKAKEAVGEQAGPGAYGKLLKTINQQAPKIMEQYKAKGVEFSVVVKDNQVIIRAKPKP